MKRNVLVDKREMNFSEYVSKFLQSNFTYVLDINTPGMLPLPGAFYATYDTGFSTYSHIYHHNHQSANPSTPEMEARTLSPQPCPPTKAPPSPPVLHLELVT